MKISTTHWYSLPLQRLSLLVPILGVLFTGLPGNAAQTIVLRYGPLEASIPVAELQQYAAEQKVSPSLQDVLKYLKSDEQKEFQEFLQAKLPVDRVIVDRVLNSEIGNRALAQITQIVVRPDDAGVQALRAGVVLGTQPTQGLSFLSFLNAYPSQKLTIDLSTVPKFLDSAVPHPPTDILPASALWQLVVAYQTTVSQSNRFQGCLFGDSISSALGQSLGDRIFNFAIGGMSSVSLVDQLKQVSAKTVKCETVVIAIGTNDAWYTTTDEQFVHNLKQTIQLARSLEVKQIFVLPAFYSTVAASKDPKLAGPIPRVEAINQLINQVAVEEKVLVEASGNQGLFAEKALREDLTVDGVHLNETGLKLYRQSLLKLFNIKSAERGN